MSLSALGQAVLAAARQMLIYTSKLRVVAQRLPTLAFARSGSATKRITAKLKVGECSHFPKVNQ